MNDLEPRQNREGRPNEESGDTGRYPTLGLKGLLREEVRPHERYAILGGFGLLVLEGVSIVHPSILHPLFPTAALIFFLYPFSKGIVTRRLIQLGIAAFLLWLFLSLAGVLFPFIVAFVFSYLASPLVSRLQSRGVPRWLTALGVVLLIVGVYSLVILVLIPAFIGQSGELLATAREIFDEADAIFDRDRITRFLEKLGISEATAHQIVVEQVEPQIEGLLTGLLTWLATFLRNVTSIVEGIVGIILIPVLSFYMTLDFNRFREFVRSKLLRNDPRYVYYLRNVDLIVNSYIRGILLTSTMVGAFAVAILSLFGVPYAVVLGVLTGLLNLIPTLGILMNIAIGIIIFTLFPEGFWYNTIVLTTTILGLHALNSYMIEPRVLGDRVGVHPVLIIASLFVFAYFMGFVGLLIAVPVTAVVMMFLREWYTRSMEGRERDDERPRGGVQSATTTGS